MVKKQMEGGEEGRDMSRSSKPMSLGGSWRAGCGCCVAQDRGLFSPLLRRGGELVSEDYSACNCPAISRLSATQNFPPLFPFLRQLLSDITFLSERKPHKYSSSPDHHISSHHDDDDDDDDDKLPRIASAAGISSTTITIVGKNQDAFYHLKPRRP